MKAVISGKLINNPELKEVKLQSGEMVNVCNYSLWVSDPNAPEFPDKNGEMRRADVPFSCTAWGEQAKSIAEKKAGDVVTGSYTLRANARNIDGKNIILPEYVLRKIDPSNEIQRELSDILRTYEASEQTHLAQISDIQPSFSDLSKAIENDNELNHDTPLTRNEQEK